MTEPISSRRAVPADAELLQAMRNDAWASARDERGGQLLHATADISPAGTDGPGDVWIGTIDGVAVGYLILKTAEAEPYRLGVIEEIYVMPEAREVGVAAELLHMAMSEAEARGCTHIESQVLPGNRAAKNFFERVGMVTRKMKVSRPLG